MDNPGRILIAPDKFKDALDARGVVAALGRGIRDRWPRCEIDACPLADGGEGTGAILAQSVGAAQRTATVLDPLGRPTTATWWFHAGDRHAIVEMAEASGLAKLRVDERQPMQTTSHGTGELLRHALEAGAERITLCVGGSATVDGGAGCLQALGWRLVDVGGRTWTTPIVGADLIRVGAIEPRRVACELTVLVDVPNPLLGPQGAARVFGPTKGATPNDVRALETRLQHWWDRLKQAGIGPLVDSGAAGGIASALGASFTARICSGFDEVARIVALEQRIQACDVVLTGEGSLDAQSRAGKVVAQVARVARPMGRACIAFAGRVDFGTPTDESSTTETPDRLTLTAFANELGLDEIVVVTPTAMEQAAALRATGENLQRAAATWATRWRPSG